LSVALVCADHVLPVWRKSCICRPSGGGTAASANALFHPVEAAATWNTAELPNEQPAIQPRLGELRSTLLGGGGPIGTSLRAGQIHPQGDTYERR
jgi:hypothetical protein